MNVVFNKSRHYASGNQLIESFPRVPQGKSTLKSGLKVGSPGREYAGGETLKRGVGSRLSIGRLDNPVLFLKTTFKLTINPTIG